MHNWNVVLLSKAYKQLKKLSYSIQDIVDEAVRALESEGAMPRYWDVKKIGIAEYRLRLNYRYRMRYRLQENELLIEIFYIGHRKEAYR